MPPTDPTRSYGPILALLEPLADFLDLAGRRRERLKAKEPWEVSVDFAPGESTTIYATVEGLAGRLAAARDVDRTVVRRMHRARGGSVERLVPPEDGTGSRDVACHADEAIALAAGFEQDLLKTAHVAGESPFLFANRVTQRWDQIAQALAKIRLTPEVLGRLARLVREEFEAVSVARLPDLPDPPDPLESPSVRLLTAVLDRLVDLVDLAKQVGLGAKPSEIRAAAAGLRDACNAATVVELRDVRLYHRTRGGGVDRVMLFPHSGDRIASHSDEAEDLAAWSVARVVGVTRFGWSGGYDEIDPDEVVEDWGGVIAVLAESPIARGPLERLKRLIREEHAAAPETPPRLPAVYRPTEGPDPTRRRAEARARRTGYRMAPTGERTKGARVTDRVYFVPGEPAERSVTKVGGLPYRASGVPWPTTASGEPMTFLAQFCFADSLDLVGRLPGDVLLIFADGPEAYLPDPYDESLAFEWYPLGLRQLAQTQEVPQTAWRLRPHFGVLARVGDDALSEAETKIGGEPHWIQGAQGHDGRFLCELGALREAPDGWDSRRDRTAPEVDGAMLEMADAGCLYFFLGADGQITWSFQCY
jgi:hypothetical protein